jgi:hypothetical protein
MVKGCQPQAQYSFILFNNLVRPLTQRQNDNLAPKLGKAAHACFKVFLYFVAMNFVYFLCAIL